MPTVESHTVPTAIPGVVVRPDIPYATSGGEALLFDLYTPQHADGALPVLVHLHGGAFRRGSRTDGAADLLPGLAARGVAVASADYRLLPGTRFPGQVDDARAAVEFVRTHAGELALDPARIALGGVSAGAHLACLAALAGDGPGGTIGDVAAVVAWSPVTDLFLVAARSPLEAAVLGPSGFLDVLGLARLEDDPDLVRRASPRHRVHPGAPPVLLIHGDRDVLAPPAQSTSLAEALTAAGARTTLLLVGGAGHGDPRLTRPEVLAAAAAYVADPPR